MSHRAVMIILAILALLLWGALLVFMNQQPPLVVNQAIFLVLFGLAIASSAIPLSYALNSRLARSRGPRYDLNRALRQGLLVGLVAVISMTLRLLQVLTWQTVAVLVLIAALIEVMLMLREGR